MTSPGARLARWMPGRPRRSGDPARELSALQRLGEKGHVAVPPDLVPVEARTLVRAVRTRNAAALGSDWVWPAWLERQNDPVSPAFVPGGDLPFLANVTLRNWTAVGNLDARPEAIVDPCGLVTPWTDGWSLDWWIGADDRWHVPSREVAVRQRLVDAAPVVETAMGIPSGDAVQRVYAVRRSSAEGGGELLVVEIENASPVPVALALAVRPYNPEGLAVVERIDLRGSAVAVDGRVALLLPRPPRRLATGTFRGGDSAATVFAGDAGERWVAPVRDEAGLAQAAFVYPLAHGATFRAVVPLEAGSRARRPAAAHRALMAAPPYPEVVPPASAVAAGWSAQGDRGMRVVLPDDRLADAVAANRRFLLLFLDGDVDGDVGSGDRAMTATDRRSWFRRTAHVLHALDRYGYHEEAARVLASYPGRQRSDGYFLGLDDEWDGNGAALVALARHWRVARDAPFVEGMVESIARGAQWIDRKRQAPGRSPRRGRGRADDRALAGLMPAGRSAAPLGPVDRSYADDFWSVAGLRAASELLRAAGQPDAAGEVGRVAAAMWSDVESSLARSAERLGTPAIPAGPLRRLDAGAAGSLVACAPLDLLAADDERVEATLDTVRAACTLAEGRAVYDGVGHAGLSPSFTMQLAAVELRAGDHRALDRLAWMLDAATTTWTWPEAVHPRLGGGTAGAGHDVGAGADVVTFVRDLLVREVPSRDEARGPATPPTLALSSLVPSSWYGQGWEVHDAPTDHGRVSYAVRWHGDRVALLWEVDPHPDVAEIRLVAPGLDPTWSTTDRKGEALLGPVPPPPTPPSGGNGAGEAVAVGAPSRSPAAPLSSPPAPPPGSSSPSPPPEGGSFA